MCNTQYTYMHAKCIAKTKFVKTKVFQQTDTESEIPVARDTEMTTKQNATAHIVGSFVESMSGWLTGQYSRILLGTSLIASYED